MTENGGPDADPVELPRFSRDVSILDPTAGSDRLRPGRAVVLDPIRGVLDPGVESGAWPTPALSHLTLGDILADTVEGGRHETPSDRAGERARSPVEAEGDDGTAGDEPRVREVVHEEPGASARESDPDTDTGAATVVRRGAAGRTSDTAEEEPTLAGDHEAFTERVRERTREDGLAERTRARTHLTVRAPGADRDATASADGDAVASAGDRSAGTDDADRRARGNAGPTDLPGASTGTEPRTATGERPGRPTEADPDRVDTTVASVPPSLGGTPEVDAEAGTDPGPAGEAGRIETPGDAAPGDPPASVESDGPSTPAMTPVDGDSDASDTPEATPGAVGGPAPGTTPDETGSPPEWARPDTDGDGPRLTVRRRSRGRDTDAAGQTGTAGSGQTGGTAPEETAGSPDATGASGPGDGDRSGPGEGDTPTGTVSTADIEKALDVPRLADRLYEQLERKRRIERERRGH